MSFLSLVQTGRIEMPYLICIQGPPGVGKSTFGADAPKPIFMGAENGTSHLDVARFPQPKSFGDVLAMLKELTEGAHEYQTLVVDSVDWIEPMVFKAVCEEAGVDSIEKAYGGYGKGYTAALEKWGQFIRALSDLREKRKMNIVLIAHSHMKEQYDPKEGKSYPRYMLKLNEKASALFREFVDCILFATYEVFIKTDNGKNKAFSSGARVCFSEWRPSFDAKNRYGLPFQFPLSWEEFAKLARAGQPEDPEKIKSNLAQLLDELKDDKLKALVQDSISKATTAVELLKIQNRLETKLAQAA